MGKKKHDFENYNSKNQKKHNQQNGTKEENETQNSKRKKRFQLKEKQYSNDKEELEEFNKLKEQLSKIGLKIKPMCGDGSFLFAFFFQNFPQIPQISQKKTVYIDHLLISTFKTLLCLT